MEFLQLIFLLSFFTSFTSSTSSTSFTSSTPHLLHSSLHVVMLGDSNTWLGGDDCTGKRGWNTWFRQWTQPQSCRSYARSGATWTCTPQTRRNTTENIGVLGDDNVIYNQICRLTDAVNEGTQPSPHIIIIMAGTNDAWFRDKRPHAFDNFIVGHASKRDETVVGHASKRDDTVVGHASERDKNVVGHASKRDKPVVGHASERDKNTVGHASKRDKPVVGHASERDKNVVGHASERDKPVVGHASERDKNVIGLASERNETDDMVTLCGAVRHGCEILKSAFPAARLVLVTPMQSTAVPDSIIAVAGDIIEDTGQQMGLSVLRLDRDGCVVSEQERLNKQLTYDGTHTNEQGAQCTARLIVDFINNVGAEL